MCTESTKLALPSPDRGGRGESRRRLGKLALLGVALLGSVGCGNGNVWVYVDNGGTKPMVVTVDDKEAATIAPGSFTKLEFPPGERKFQVRSGDTTLYTGTKDLKKSDRFLATRRLFFNPDGRHRYLVYTVQYGSSPFKGMVQRAVGAQPKTYEDEIRADYQELLNIYKLQPESSWFEVPDGALVLQEPPEYVRTKGYTATRTVLTRVSPRDYDFLQAARNKSRPTEKDLDGLDDVLDKVLSTKP